MQAGWHPVRTKVASLFWLALATSCWRKHRDDAPYESGHKTGQNSGLFDTRQIRNPMLLFILWMK